MMRRPPRSTLFPTRRSSDLLVENAATVGAYFLGELQRFSEEFPKLVSNVRGRGLMCAFDLPEDRKSTRLNSSHSQISYAVFCLKKKKKKKIPYKTKKK